MAQGLHLSQRLTQSLVLSPQMQQSLALLQAPTLELKALVEAEMQQNPVLEEAPQTDADQPEKVRNEDGEVADSQDPTEPPADVVGETHEVTNEKGDGDTAEDFLAEFAKLSQLDQEWRDHYAATSAPIRQSAEDEEKRQFMFDSIVAPTSLQEILLEQVRESSLNAEQRSIAEMLIGNIDDHGYLKTSIDELAYSTNLPAPKIDEVLKVVQTFDPPGVGARDLRECLMRQMERAGDENSDEYRIVRDHMDALGKRRIPELARALGVDVEDVQEAIGRIAHAAARK